MPPRAPFRPRPLYKPLIAALDEAGVHSLVGVVALPNDASEALHRSLGFTHVGNAGVGAQVREADRLRLLATDEPAAALTLTKLSVCIPRVGSAGAVSAPFNAALIVKCIGAEWKWSRKGLRGESNGCTIKA